MTIVSVSIPEELLERIDEFVEKNGYSGRSEVMRDGARTLLDEFKDSNLENRRLVATVTVMFDFDESSKNKVEKKMIDLRHENEDIVRSNVHTHIGDNYCMELFVIEGSLDEERDFVGNVRSTRGVLDINYTVNPIDDLD